MGIILQTTLKHPVRFSGVGLHSGATVTMIVHPASAEYGIWFRRSDLASDNLISAHWANVDPNAQLCTRISNEAGVSVSTVEHVMAALAGCGVHNALIEVSHEEVPILDGSARPFVEAFLKTGLRAQSAPVRVIEVLKTVEFEQNGARAILSPADGLEIGFHINFEDAAIGQQEKVLNMSNGSFVRELCDCRTFCRQADVDMMRANGLALGGTLENAVVVDGDQVVSPGGLRRQDEAVRHKMLDALGDLYMAGAPLVGRYDGYRAGHALTNKLLRALFADIRNYRMITCTPDLARKLPGVGVRSSDIPAAA